MHVKPVINHLEIEMKKRHYFELFSTFKWSTTKKAFWYSQQNLYYYTTHLAKL